MFSFRKATATPHGKISGGDKVFQQRRVQPEYLLDGLVATVALAWGQLPFVSEEERRWLAELIAEEKERECAKWG